MFGPNQTLKKALTFEGKHGEHGGLSYDMSDRGVRPKVRLKA